MRSPEYEFIQYIRGPALTSSDTRSKVQPFGHLSFLEGWTTTAQPNLVHSLRTHQARTLSLAIVQVEMSLNELKIMLSKATQLRPNYNPHRSHHERSTNAGMPGDQVWDGVFLSTAPIPLPKIGLCFSPSNAGSLPEYHRKWYLYYYC